MSIDLYLSAHLKIIMHVIVYIKHFADAWAFCVCRNPWSFHSVYLHVCSQYLSFLSSHIFTFCIFVVQRYIIMQATLLSLKEWSLILSPIYGNFIVDFNVSIFKVKLYFESTWYGSSGCANLVWTHLHSPSWLVSLQYTCYTVSKCAVHLASGNDPSFIRLEIEAV